MTTQLEEAARQALEALECYKGFIDDAHIIEGQWHWIDGGDEAITALRAALEQPSNVKQVIELYDSPEQPAQDEPVAWVNWCAATGKRSVSFECESELASEPLYAGITQNTQGHYSKFHSWFDSELHRQKYTKDHPAYLAAQEAWNAANDDAQHRINRLSAEIEAWKARFKIAEDALVKLNGIEREPVAWMYDIARYGPTDLRGQQWRPAISRTKPNIHDSLVRDLTPLYTRPQAREPLTDEQIKAIVQNEGFLSLQHFARAIEAAHGIGEKK